MCVCVLDCNMLVVTVHKSHASPLCVANLNPTTPSTPIGQYHSIQSFHCVCPPVLLYHILLGVSNNNTILHYLFVTVFYQFKNKRFGSFSSKLYFRYMSFLYPWCYINITLCYKTFILEYLRILHRPLFL